MSELNHLCKCGCGTPIICERSIGEWAERLADELIEIDPDEEVEEDLRVESQRERASGELN